MIQKMVALIGSAILLLAVVAFLNSTSWSLESYGGGGVAGSAGGTGGTGTAGGTGSPGGTGGTGGTGATGTAGGTGGTGAAATATAIPSPSAVVGTAALVGAATPVVVTIPTGGATPVVAGDCMMMVYYHVNTDTAFPAQTGSYGVAWDKGNFPYNDNINTQTVSLIRKYIANTDITNGNLNFGTVAAGNGFLYCAEFFRHVSCGQDAIAVNAKSTGSTSPAPGTLTTINDGDMLINAGIFNTSATYTPPSGWTGAQELYNTIGCFLDYKYQATAGASTPTGTLSVSGSWGDVQDDLRNINGTQ